MLKTHLDLLDQAYRRSTPDEGFWYDLPEALLRMGDKRLEGEGDAFFKVGEHQFLAIFEVDAVRPDRVRHFGLMVRDAAQLAEVREKVSKKWGLELSPRFRCDFHDPWGNRIQVGDLHDESLVWLLPYQEIQKAGITFEGASESAL